MTDRLEMIIADRDTGYMVLLSDYVRETEWSRKLSVRQATRPEMLQEYVRTRKAQLYLVHPDFEIGEHSGGCRIRLCETKQEADERSGMMGVYKYQPLHQLLGKVIELYRQFTASGNRAAVTDEPAVYAVFSGSGGVGKTTVSVQLARAFAEKGERCLYWNMELVPGRNLPKEADAELAARFVYGLRTNAPWTGDCVPGLISRAEPFGFDYFSGFSIVRESLELTRGDVAKLVEWLKRTKRYDMIIFDLEATLHERVLAALAESDAVVWIVTEDGESSDKTFRLLAELERWQGGGPDARKIRFVMNKHMGFNGHALLNAGSASNFTAPIAVKLPYVPNWKQVHGASRQSPEPMFYAGIARLANDIRLSGGGATVDNRHDNQIAARAYP
ncbi:hypothetical protein [Paenibacillus mesophilus]|uniref:nucleotide-binding protein n=1 Tax=Paenibacillus mesophilus TaxID=2582849 RepID=UPI0013051353|nr:hypothetical protein [Paenibacillus mesophilus]